MVQLPQALERVCGKGLVLEHAFGRYAVCLHTPAGGGGVLL
jgi:hypothetical protein